MKKNRDQIQKEAYDKLLENIKNNYVSLFCAATGYGKGRIISMLGHYLSGQGFSVAVITNRVVLVNDLSQRMDATVYCASLNRKEHSKLMVISKQSVKNVSADYILVDECHGYTEDYLKGLKAEKAIVGFSATPFSESGYIYGEGKFWPKPIYNFGLKDSKINKMVCDYKIFGMQTSFDISKYKIKNRDFTKKELNEIIKGKKYKKQVPEIIKATDKYDRKKVVIVCVNIEHAQDVYSEFLLYGNNCVLIHSKLKDSQEEIKEFMTNDSIVFAITVSMLSEGFDYPRVDCIALLRPTKSPRFMVQVCGRALRIHPEKDFALLLDYGDVFYSCGFPDDPLVPEEGIGGGPSATLVLKQQRISKCEKCSFVFDSSHSKVCPDCGYNNKEQNDYEKNLKRSLEDKDSIKYYMVTKNTGRYQNITAKNVRYITYNISGLKVTLFGGMVDRSKNMIEKYGGCLLICDVSGKYPKVLRIQYPKGRVK